MKHLAKYVPVASNGKQQPIIVHGDQLSVERMIESKIAMSMSWDPCHRMNGLIPRPQGFHKRCIILQVSIFKLTYFKNQKTFLSVVK